MDEITMNGFCFGWVDGHSRRVAAHIADAVIGAVSRGTGECGSKPDGGAHEVAYLLWSNAWHRADEGYGS